MNAIALVTTAGFADVLSLGRQNRADPYAPHVGTSPWLQALPETWRIELPGRVSPRGEEVRPLDLSGLAAAIDALPARPQAVALCLMFADRNPAHERAAQSSLGELLPGVPVACSHTLAAQEHWGEYEWTVATVEAAHASLARVPARSAHGDDHAAQARHSDIALPPLALALESLCNAMQQTLVEQAVSSVVREAMDCAAAVFFPDGRLLAQARSLPLLLGSLTPAVRGILAHYPTERMADGDCFVSNDPWNGGTHLPDWVLVAPVIADGQVRALAACILHHQDVGGITPGSVPTEARSSFQEGLRLPPVCWVHQGLADEALTRLFTANSRLPANLMGDLAAQRACLDQGVIAMRALIDQLGSGFEPACNALWQATETATRAAIAQAPDGRWTFRDALDGDGISDALVPLEVVIEKTGDQLTIDLRGCADQTTGPVNASRGAVWAAVSYFARSLAPQAPSNGACTEALRLLTREGSVVDPSAGAAVNARTNLVKLMANALLGAWAQALPDRQPAANAGVAVVLSLSGEVEGRPWILTEIIASAAGGAPWGPGGSAVSTDVGNARNTPARVLEAQAPLRIERLTLRRGSGGAGHHDGGCGVVRAYRLLAGTGQVSYRGERHRTQAPGLAGGLPGVSGNARIERADGRIEHLPAKARVAWEAGDLLVIETAGAGGWGAPASSKQVPGTGARGTTPQSTTRPQEF